MSLIQHWPLNDNAASTTVVATVGNNASLEGGDNTSAKTTAGPGGSITAALALNGTDDGINIAGAGISFASGSPHSESIWFNVSSVTDQIIIGRDSTNVNHQIRIATATTISVRFNTVHVAFTVPSISTSAWHHLLVTKTVGDSVRVFVDGVESSSGAQANAATFSPTRIARGSTFFTAGSFAQVKVYDSDESANVATLYSEGVSQNRRRRVLLGV